MDYQIWMWVSLGVAVLLYTLAATNLTDSYGNKSKNHSFLEMIVFASLGVIVWSILTMLIFGILNA